MKTIAKSKSTGLYFNGINFTGTKEEAIALRPGTTSDDFKLMWASPAEIEQVEEAQSFAMRIHKGEITRHQAAAEHVAKQQRDFNQKEFIVRTPDRKYKSRKVFTPKRGVDRTPFVKFSGTEIALVWSEGELAIDHIGIN